MRPFEYSRAGDALDAVRAASVAAPSPTESPVQYLGGGTTLVDLMKLDVMRPTRLVDITGLDRKRYGAVEVGDKGVRIGALARMSEVADNAELRRDYPVVTDALWLAASQQLRVMARVGGNVLQRTRCSYFRDTKFTSCNKREPGSGCAALEGQNRGHAILGGSGDCIAMYPGDWAQALIALDANVEVLGSGGARSIRFADLHRPPGSTPQIETVLKPGDLITAFVIPASPVAKRSLYRKVRDRESYAFASASAAVALDLDGDTVRDARIALGGVATVPWRAREAEASLKGKRLDQASATAAAKIAFAGAAPREHNRYKLPLGQATVVRALLEAQRMEIA